MSAGTVFLTYSRRIGACRAPGPGDEQLLAVRVGLGQGDGLDPAVEQPSGQVAVLVARRHDLSGLTGTLPTAGNAVAVGAVFLPPGFAGHAHPPVAGCDTPRQAVRAGRDFHRPSAQFPGRFPSRRFRAGRVMVAAGAQSRGVIVLSGAAAAAWRRRDRATWPAFETARDFPHPRRPDPAGLAEVLDDAAHAGGIDLCRPSRGAMSVVVPVAAAGGLRAATLSGSLTIRSAGVHSSTAQITSRSSSPHRHRGGSPPAGHLPGADLQPGLGQPAAHLRRFPDAALSSSHPQVPAHQFTPFPYRVSLRYGY